jgi:hypothetical protein
MDSAHQADGYSRCTKTFQEASAIPLGPGTKTTSKLQPKGKEKTFTKPSKTHEIYPELTRAPQPKPTHVQKFT